MFIWVENTELKKAPDFKEMVYEEALQHSKL